MTSEKIPTPEKLIPEEEPEIPETVEKKSAWDHLREWKHKIGTKLGDWFHGRYSEEELERQKGILALKSKEQRTDEDNERLKELEKGFSKTLAEAAPKTVLDFALFFTDTKFLPDIVRFLVQKRAIARER